MTKIEVGDNENLDEALKRFRKTLQKSGRLRDARKHERYEKPSARKRREREKALRRRSR